MMEKIKKCICENCGVELQSKDETNYLTMIISTIALSLATFALGFVIANAT